MSIFIIQYDHNSIIYNATYNVACRLLMMRKCLQSFMILSDKPLSDVKRELALPKEKTTDISIYI